MPRSNVSVITDKDYKSAFEKGKALYDAAETMVAHKKGNPEQIAKLYQDALKEFDFASCYALADPQAFLYTGILQYKMGNKEKAKDEFEHGIVNINRHRLLDTPPQLYLWHAITIVELSKDFEGAIKDLDKVIPSGHKAMEAHALRGYCHLKLTHYQQAAHDYNEAVRLNPENAHLYFYRAKARQHFPEEKQDAYKDYQQVETLLQQQGKVGTSQLMPKMLLGRAYLALYQNDKNKAFADFSRVIGDQYSTGSAVASTQSQQVRAYKSRAALWEKEHKILEALTDMEYVINLMPHENRSEAAEAYATRGRLNFQQKKLQQALEDYNAAINIVTKLSPLPETSRDLYHRRGNVKRTMGDSAGALEDYRKALLHNAKCPTKDTGLAITYSDQQTAMGDYQGAFVMLETVREALNSYNEPNKNVLLGRTHHALANANLAKGEDILSASPGNADGILALDSALKSRISALETQGELTKKNHIQLESQVAGIFLRHRLPQNALLHYQSAAALASDALLAAQDAVTVKENVATLTEYISLAEQYRKLIRKCGNCYQMTGSPEKSLEQREVDAEAVCQLATYYRKRGQAYATLLQDAEQHQNSHPLSPEQKHEWEAAQTGDFLKAEALNDSLGRHYIYIAQKAEELQKFSLAAEYYRKIPEDDKTYAASAIKGLAVIDAREKRFEEAERRWNKLLTDDIAPKDAKTIDYYRASRGEMYQSWAEHELTQDVKKGARNPIREKLTKALEDYVSVTPPHYNIPRALTLLLQQMHEQIKEERERRLTDRNRCNALREELHHILELTARLERLDIKKHRAVAYAQLGELSEHLAHSELKSAKAEKQPPQASVRDDLDAACRNYRIAADIDPGKKAYQQRSEHAAARREKFLSTYSDNIGVRPVLQPVQAPPAAEQLAAQAVAGGQPQPRSQLPLQHELQHEKKGFLSKVASFLFNFITFKWLREWVKEVRERHKNTKPEFYDHVPQQEQQEKVVVLEPINRRHVSQVQREAARRQSVCNDVPGMA